LATYIAMSARCISVSTSSPCSGKQAMPSDAPTSSSAPSTRNGRSSACRIFWPTSAPASASGAVGQQDRELVAAQPRDGVARAQHAGDPRADELEQLVAAVVAERVVDLLELVEVEQHHDRLVPSRWAVDSARSTRSWNSARFGSPVRTSCRARLSLSSAWRPGEVQRDERQQQPGQQRRGEVGDEHGDRREAERAGPREDR
jgi:hypothetical protein